MRDKLKQLRLKLTELCEYAKVTRPTMYKYIEDYDNGNTTKIKRSILDLFKVIEDPNTISKSQVINYILNKEKAEFEVKLPVKLRSIYKLLLDLDKEQLQKVKKYIKGDMKND